MNYVQRFIAAVWQDAGGTQVQTCEKGWLKPAGRPAGQRTLRQSHTRVHRLRSSWCLSGFTRKSMAPSCRQAATSSRSSWLDITVAAANRKISNNCHDMQQPAGRPPAGVSEKIMPAGAQDGELIDLKIEHHIARRIQSAGTAQGRVGISQQQESLPTTGTLLRASVRFILRSSLHASLLGGSCSLRMRSKNGRGSGPCLSSKRSASSDVATEVTCGDVRLGSIIKNRNSCAGLINESQGGGRRLSHLVRQVAQQSGHCLP